MEASVKEATKCTAKRGARDHLYWIDCFRADTNAQIGVVVMRCNCPGCAARKLLEVKPYGNCDNYGVNFAFREVDIDPRGIPVQWFDKVISHDESGAFIALFLDGETLH